MNIEDRTSYIEFRSAMFDVLTAVRHAKRSDVMQGSRDKE